MSDTYLNSLLGENEQVLFVTHQHWLVLAGKILTEILLMVAWVVLVSIIWRFWVPNNFMALGYLLLVFPLISLCWDVLVWSKRKYVVTSRRVIQLSGMFSKNVTDSSLEKVNDVKMSQSFLGRMFDYGDIEILTASELGVNIFKRIGQPIHYKTAMINAKEKLERAPAEARPARNTADLLAQLDELRQHGVLTEAEFQSKKADLLKKM
ncbi:MAG: PH domain-containing protein [Chloroflexi bacterium]|nr:PH domain-containing protein [Chloroflexota bacterium]